MNAPTEGLVVSVSLARLPWQTYHGCRMRQAYHGAQRPITTRSVISRLPFVATISRQGRGLPVFVDMLALPTRGGGKKGNSCVCIDKWGRRW